MLGVTDLSAFLLGTQRVEFLVMEGMRGDREQGIVRKLEELVLGNIAIFPDTVSYDSKIERNMVFFRNRREPCSAILPAIITRKQPYVLVRKAS